MRIGIDATWAGISGTGTGSYTFGLISALVAQPGHEFVLYFPPGQENSNPLWSVSASHVTRRVVGGRLHHDRILVGLTAASRADDLDVFHSPGYMLPLWTGPKVVTFHDANMFTHRDQQWRTGRRLSWLALCLQTALASRTARRIMVDSHHAGKEISRVLRLRPGRVSVVYPGVDERYFGDISSSAANPIRERHDLTNYFLFVSQLTPQKNIEGVVRAFSTVQSSSTKLAIVGREDGPYFRDTVLPLIHDLGLTNRVATLGVVSNEELPGIYAGASALLFPTFAEGFGLPALEAMALGTPVIASDTTCLPEVLGDAALLINPYDSSELAGAMDRIQVDQNLRDSLIRKGHERAGMYKWERAAKETLDVYHDATNHKFDR